MMASTAREDVLIQMTLIVMSNNPKLQLATRRSSQNAETIRHFVPQEYVRPHQSATKMMQLKSFQIHLFAFVCVLGLSFSDLHAQQGNPVPMNEILDELRFNRLQSQGKQIDRPWWQVKTTESLSPQAMRVEAGIHELLRMAIANSAKVNIARHIPLIRQTAVQEAISDFDWTRYVDTMWADTSDPIGSSLTVGDTSGASRFRDHNWTLDAGVRRRTFSGADVSLSQQFGHQNNNSTFFIPNDQATSRIVLGFTQPLMRGRGRYYNTSLILLANIDVGSSSEEFNREIQSHLLEVSRSYWSMYLERASLAQKVKLYLQTKEIYAQLRSRQEIDAQRTQLVSAKAALDSREADLIRAVASVKNAETRLRALINAPELSGDSSMIELVPADHPTVVPVMTDLQTEFATAMQNRPEIRAALQSIRAAGVRLDMASHEMLPQLNLVTQTYLAGLRGESDFGDAWLDQFREGEPSYSVGFQYELPVGRRAATARLSRRQLEISQMQEEYRNILEMVRAEVEVAVREVETAYLELSAKNRARHAAELEVETLQTRWKELAEGESGGLSLQALLQAQERVTEAEFEFARSQLTYNLSLINMRHANGTLISVVNEPTMVQQVQQQVVVNQPPMVGAMDAQHLQPVTGMQQYQADQSFEPAQPIGMQPNSIAAPQYPLQQLSSGNQFSGGTIIEPFSVDTMVPNR